MKKVLSLLFAICLLLTVCFPVNAITSEQSVTIVQPRWTYLQTVTASLNINLLGVATCDGTGTSRVIKDVKIIVRLQQETDTGWSTLKTWTATASGAVGAGGSHAVAKGYNYRTVSSVYVYDDDGNIIETGSASDTFYY